MFSIEENRCVSHTLNARLINKSDIYAPKTEFGKRLVALRRKAIASGLRLLTEDEILEEVKQRRGEFEELETDLH